MLASFLLWILLKISIANRQHATKRRCKTKRYYRQLNIVVVCNQKKNRSPLQVQHIVCKIFICPPDTLFFTAIKCITDNNGPERAIRNIRVKQKTSVQFKNAGNCKSILHSTACY